MGKITKLPVHLLFFQSCTCPGEDAVVTTTSGIRFFLLLFLLSLLTFLLNLYFFFWQQLVIFSSFLKSPTGEMPLSSRCLPLSPSIPFCFLMSAAASSLVVSSYSCIFLCLVYSDSTVTLLAVHPYALLLHLFIFIEHCCCFCC